MKIALIVVVVLLLAALVFGGKFVSIRNDLVTKKESVSAAWSQVDVALQRRADLIPNLVETVKGYAKHEEGVMDDVASARAALIGAKTPQDKIAANNQLDGALGRLLVVVENYPNLKANENFLRLQDELAGTENRIAIERRKYNETVQSYNTQIQLFPNNIVASISGFQRDDAYFKTEPGARTAPKVAVLEIHVRTLQYFRQLHHGRMGRKRPDFREPQPGQHRRSGRSVLERLGPGHRRAPPTPPRLPCPPGPPRRVPRAATFCSKPPICSTAASIPSPPR